eukprot:gene2553-72_t
MGRPTTWDTWDAQPMLLPCRQRTPSQIAATARNAVQMELWLLIVIISMAVVAVLLCLFLTVVTMFVCRKHRDIQRKEKEQQQAKAAKAAQ